MVQKGDILYDPVRRASVTFLLTSADTKGNLLQLDISISPGGKMLEIPLHVHPKQTERVLIKSGKIWATIDGHKRLYSQGEIILIQPGTPHQLENASHQEELNFVCEIAPALASESLIETAMALAHFGDVPAAESGIPLLQYAATLNRFPDQYYTAAYPVWLQKLVFYLLAPVAQLMGYKAEAAYKKAIVGNSTGTLLYS